MKPTNLRVNGLHRPLGYKYKHLTFSWETQGNEPILMQRLEISTDSEFATCIKQVETQSQWNQISMDTTFLQLGRRYFWRVITETADATATSSSWFETAKSGTWMADWLSYQGKSRDSVCFTKKFSTKKEIDKARLYACGFGIYECLLNTQAVTEEVLLPGYHSYDLLNQYQSFDVTSLLKKENHLEFLVGNGWYKGRFIFEGGQENIYGDKQKVICELHVEYKDGTKEVLVSDDSWEVHTSPILANSIYDGEEVDYSLAIQPLVLAVLTEDKELLQPRNNPPIKKQEPISVKRTFLDTKGELVLDFGQIITGWVIGEIFSSKKVTLRFGELLQEGAFYQENLRTAEQTLTVTAGDLPCALRPHFTFFGFRYVAVTGLTVDEAKELKAYPIWSDMDELFQFESGNKKLNQLVENIKWSQRDNFLDIPTDCPQRDERMGWTGDVTIFANASCYNFESKSFYEHYLRNLALEQQLLDGSVPFFVPYPKVEPFEGINPFLVTDGAAVWGDVATTLPYQLFRHFRDKGLLEQNIDVMIGWVDYLHKRDLEHGGKHLWDFDRQLGDWLALDNGNPHNPIGATDPNLIASAFYYRSTSYLAICLEVLGDERSEKYHRIAEKIKQAILKKYFVGDELYLEPATQTGISLLLNNGLYPSEVGKEKLLVGLVELLAENQNYLNTGFVGTPELTQALAENGRPDLAYTLLFNENSPSWLYEVNMGATTIWERWNSILPDGTISGTEMNSLNHYAYGAVQAFIVENVIGLRYSLNDPTTEIHSLDLRPCFDHRLPWVKGSLKTPHGRIMVAWEWLDEAQVEVNVTIPGNTQLRYFDETGQEKILKTGKHFLYLKM